MWTAKTKAVTTLITEGRKERLTQTGLNRVRKACKDLQLTAEEMLEIEFWLDFRDYQGNLLPQFK